MSLYVYWIGWDGETQMAPKEPFQVSWINVMHILYLPMNFCSFSSFKVGQREGIIKEMIFLRLIMRKKKKKMEPESNRFKHKGKTHFFLKVYFTSPVVW